MNPSFVVVFAFVAYATARTIAPPMSVDNVLENKAIDVLEPRYDDSFSFKNEFPQHYQQYYGLNHYGKTYPYYNKHQSPEHFQYQHQYPFRGYQDVDITFDVISKDIKGPTNKGKFEKVVYGVTGYFKQQDKNDVEYQHVRNNFGDHERPEYFHNGHRFEKNFPFHNKYQTPVDYEYGFEHTKNFPYYNKHQLGKNFDYDNKFGNYYPHKYQTPVDYRYNVERENYLPYYNRYEKDFPFYNKHQTPVDYKNGFEYHHKDFPYYNKYQTGKDVDYGYKHQAPVDHKYGPSYENDLPYRYQIPGKYEHDFQHEKGFPTFDKHASYVKH